MTGGLLDFSDSTADCLGCGEPVPYIRQWIVVSIDGVPVDSPRPAGVPYSVEQPYCRDCYRKRMRRAGRHPSPAGGP